MNIIVRNSFFINKKILTYTFFSLGIVPQSALLLQCFKVSTLKPTAGCKSGFYYLMEKWS